MVALASARRGAAALVEKDDFDGALDLLKALPAETARLLPGELKTATDEIVASARERVGAIEADVLKHVAAARLESARTLLADLAELKAAGAFPGVKGLVEELGSKIAAAAAAKRLADERAAVLAGFDRLMISGEHAGARDYAKSKAAAGGEVAKVLRGGADLAGRLVDEPASRVRGARSLVGREARLKLIKGHMTGVVKAVTDTEMVVVTTYAINRETREKRNVLKWVALHADQKAEFARRGGLKMSAAEEAIAAAYAALASDDLEAAGKSADAAGDLPLGKHLCEVVRVRIARRVYEMAMKRARELVKRKELRDAVTECEKALAAIPDDDPAAELLAEIRRLLKAPETLTLDLGDGVTMVFVYVKPGTFVMGGESTSEGRFQCVEVPKHTVTITKGFYLGKYEVTQAQFQAVMGSVPGRQVARGPDHPAGNVSWQAANEFCRKASAKTERDVRLPTEAEWEFACRAGTDTKWSHGDDAAELTEYAWLSANSGGQTHPVGTRKPNPWGLYDMQGNVTERIADFYRRDFYENGPREDPFNKAGRFGYANNGTTIVRGGTYKTDAETSVPGKRWRGGGHAVYPDWGLRAAMTAEGRSP
jgi:formylglycine-generating enzyme required for sulfatase activity